MNNIEGLTTLEAESTLLDQIIDFNKKYARYVTCNDSTMNPLNKLNCSDIDMNYNTVQEAYSKILLQTSNGDNVFGSILDVSNTRLSNNINYAVYDASRVYIKNTYNNEILNLRNELDTKLRELNTNNNSISAEYKNRFDSTIYSGLMLTVLVTSMLYYIFQRV
jgi:hypothetical protein